MWYGILLSATICIETTGLGKQAQGTLSLTVLRSVNFICMPNIRAQV